MTATLTKRVAVRCRHCGLTDVVEWVVLAEGADLVEDRRAATDHWARSHRRGCSARTLGQFVRAPAAIGPLGPHPVEPTRSEDWLTGGAT